MHERRFDFVDEFGKGVASCGCCCSCEMLGAALRSATNTSADNRCRSVNKDVGRFCGECPLGSGELIELVTKTFKVVSGSHGFMMGRVGHIGKSKDSVGTCLGSTDARDGCLVARDDRASLCSNVLMSGLAPIATTTQSDKRFSEGPCAEMRFQPSRRDNPSDRVLKADICRPVRRETSRASGMRMACALVQAAPRPTTPRATAQG